MWLRSEFDEKWARLHRPARSLSKAFLESFDTYSSHVDMTLARRRRTRTFGSTRSRLGVGMVMVMARVEGGRAEGARAVYA